MKGRIIHIDTAKSWRGGQQQVAYLHEGVIQRGIDSLMVCPEHSVMASWCRERRLPVQTLPLCCEADIVSALRLGRFVRKTGRCILHAHNAHALSIALMTKLRVKRQAAVIASRRVDFPLKIHAPAQWKYRTALLDRIICISHEIQRIMQSHGISEDKLIVIPSGIDIHKFDSVDQSPTFREEWNIPPHHKIVCTVAALTGHKDYPTFLESARLVLMTYSEVTFLAVGEGKQAEEIKSLAEKKGLEKHFIFTGFRTDVGRFLKNSDLFVMASKKEGLGTSILDAETAGLAVIGTDAGGIPEVIRHGENGFIVPRQQPKALSDAILTLLRDDEKRKMFGEKSLAFVRNFDISFTVQKHIKLYEEIFKKY
ncbi:MAG: glycosyltransferase family 4 protein [Candidatus Marinimicrobia bacterium]|nr:glycosyltransferase family 4 protein [Candidatus Neomarinimicrobiota bacterium]